MTNRVLQSQVLEIDIWLWTHFKSLKAERPGVLLSKYTKSLGWKPLMHRVSSNRLSRDLSGTQVFFLSPAFLSINQGSTKLPQVCVVTFCLKAFRKNQVLLYTFHQDLVLCFILIFSYLSYYTHYLSLYLLLFIQIVKISSDCQRS